MYAAERFDEALRISPDSGGCRVVFNALHQRAVREDDATVACKLMRQALDMYGGAVALKSGSDLATHCLQSRPEYAGAFCVSKRAVARSQSAILPWPLEIDTSLPQRPRTA